MIEGDGYALLQGGCFEVLRDYPDASFASVVCDPPQGIETLPAPAVWAEIFRVAEPGAFLLALSHPRTWHRLACAIEDAGWIYFDTLARIVNHKTQTRRRLQQGWQPIALFCKGLGELPGKVIGVTTTMGSFSLGDLVRLVTPKGGCLLDPFMGVGDIGVAALEAGFGFVGIDLDSLKVGRVQERLATVGPKD